MTSGRVVGIGDGEVASELWPELRGFSVFFKGLRIRNFWDGNARESSEQKAHLYILGVLSKLQFLWVVAMALLFDPFRYGCPDPRRTKRCSEPGSWLAAHQQSSSM